MALLIALVNIIGWGLIPLTVKDSPQSQIAGMGIGASATALIIYLFTRPAFDAATWAVAFVAGMLWTNGTIHFIYPNRCFNLWRMANGTSKSYWFHCLSTGSNCYRIKF